MPGTKNILSKWKQFTFFFSFSSSSSNSKIVVGGLYSESKRKPTSYHSKHTNQATTYLFHVLNLSHSTFSSHWTWDKRDLMHSWQFFKAWQKWIGFIRLILYSPGSRSNQNLHSTNSVDNLLLLLSIKLSVCNLYNGH